MEATYRKGELFVEGERTLLRRFSFGGGLIRCVDNR
jgi:hypothetical protein